jgi:hypothetical protein
MKNCKGVGPWLPVAAAPQRSRGPRRIAGLTGPLPDSNRVHGVHCLQMQAVRLDILKAADSLGLPDDECVGWHCGDCKGYSTKPPARVVSYHAIFHCARLPTANGESRDRTMQSAKALLLTPSRDKLKDLCDRNHPTRSWSGGIGRRIGLKEFEHQGGKLPA